MAAPGPMPSATTGLLEDILKHFAAEDNSSTLLVYVGTEIWKLPSKLVAEYTNTFKDSHKVSLLDFTDWPQDENSFQLFIEFMFTGCWKDRGLKVDWDRNYLEYKASGQTVYDPAWKSKAAISACLLGTDIEAKRFHNYAMAQVFHTFCTQRTFLTPSIATYTCLRSYTQVGELMFDLIIQHWNRDKDAINSNDKEWLKFFNAHKEFRDRFLLEVGKDTEALELNNYLLSEYGKRSHRER